MVPGPLPPAAHASFRNLSCERLSGSPVGDWMVIALTQTRDLQVSPQTARGWSDQCLG